MGVCEGGHLYNQSVKCTDIHTDRAQIKLIGNIGTWRSECSLNQGVQSQFWRINLAPPQCSHIIRFTFYNFFWWRRGIKRLTCIFSSRMWIYENRLKNHRNKNLHNFSILKELLVSFFFLNSELAYNVHVWNKGILWNVDRNLKVRNIQKVYSDKIAFIKKYLNLKPIQALLKKKMILSFTNHINLQKSASCSSCHKKFLTHNYF